MAKKVHKLKHVTPESFKIICISSHQNDYRLSWALNDKLKINLQRTNDHTVKAPKSNIEQRFSHYVSQLSDSPVTYHLISNKCENGYLLKKFQNIDYFLKISGTLENISVQDLVDRLKKISIINTAFELENMPPVQIKRLSF